MSEKIILLFFTLTNLSVNNFRHFGYSLCSSLSTFSARDILSSLISIDVIACPIIGPSSTPDLTRCTVQPANLTPDFMALSWVFNPLKDGRREG